MSAHVSDSKVFEALRNDPKRTPPCNTPSTYPYLRNYAGDKEKAYCAKTIAGHWDAKLPAKEGALAVTSLGHDVQVISLQKNSLMYHGYGGQKQLPMSRPSTSGVQHLETLHSCDKDDSMACYCHTSFPWLHKLCDWGDSAEAPFKAEPLFFGPKDVADRYGENKRNTVVVFHSFPSGIYDGNASTTHDVHAPLYQIVEPNGMTITFSTTRDVVLVDLSSLQNVKSILESDDKLKIQLRPQIEEIKAAVKRSGSYSQETERDRLENMTLDFETILIEGWQDEEANDEGIERVKRVSDFAGDAKLVKIVKRWLTEQGLEGKVDGWFWGGAGWASCSKKGSSLATQEFCFFNPQGLLSYNDRSEIKPFEYPGIPLYEDFWKKSISTKVLKETYQQGFHNIVSYPRSNYL